jgi:hypothetical protein
MLACWIGVIFGTSASALFADDKPPVAPDGYKMVPVKSGNKITYIKVRNQLDPYRSLKDTSHDGTYDPMDITSHLNGPSSFANKSFSTADASLSKNSAAVEDRDHQTFITKAYTGDSSSSASNSIPNGNTKYKTETSTAFNRTSSGFDKSFINPEGDAAQNKTALFAANTVSDQGRTYLGADKKSSTFSSSMANKSFEGPEADAIHHDVKRLNAGLMEMKDLPNRALTIDEVRALINHGAKPNTDVVPEAPSKPLNAPDYKPEPSPAPPDKPSDDDKIDLTPAPGLMASPPPENQEALPH